MPYLGEGERVRGLAGRERARQCLAPAGAGAGRVLVKHPAGQGETVRCGRGTGLCQRSRARPIQGKAEEGKNTLALPAAAGLGTYPPPPEIFRLAGTGAPAQPGAHRPRGPSRASLATVTFHPDTKRFWGPERPGADPVGYGYMLDIV